MFVGSKRKIMKSTHDILNLVFDELNTMGMSLTISKIIIKRNNRSVNPNNILKVRLIFFALGWLITRKISFNNISPLGVIGLGLFLIMLIALEMKIVNIVSV